MGIETSARRYINAVKTLHSVHSSTDVHDNGGLAGAAITEHCAITCHVVGGYFDLTTQQVVHGPSPHEAVLKEYYAAKEELESMIGEDKR